jgi:hypothetical protein
LIVDGANRKLNHVNEVGELSPPTLFGHDVPILFSATADTIGSIFATSLGDHSVIAKLDEAGHLLSARGVPFPGIDTLPRLIAPSWVHSASIGPLLQLVCIFPGIEQILLVGADSNASVRMFPIGDGHVAQTIVEHNGDTITVSFAKPYLPVPGGTIFGGRLYVLIKKDGKGLDTDNVEVYDLANQRLIQRIVLPITVSGIAVGHGLLVGVRGADRPAVVAWRLPH